MLCSNQWGFFVAANSTRLQLIKVLHRTIILLRIVVYVLLVIYLCFAAQDINIFLAIRIAEQINLP